MEPDGGGFRKARALLAASIALLTVSAGPAFADELPPVMPADAHATTDCANPRLPAEILNGWAYAMDPAPLRTSHYPYGKKNARLTLAVASDEPSRQLGLMCVLRLKPGAGMIFVFDRSDSWEFWMKNTLVPLDMLWLGKDGRITAIAANVPASTLTTPNEKVARRRGRGLYVVELRGGEAKRLGLKVGSKITVCSDGFGPEKIDRGDARCGNG